MSDYLDRLNRISELITISWSQALKGTETYNKLWDALKAMNDVIKTYKNEEYYQGWEDNAVEWAKNKSKVNSSTVYSDSFDEMVQKDFTYKGNKYTWNDIDCVYYNDNGDEDDFFMEIPEGAITSSKAIKSSINNSIPDKVYIKDDKGNKYYFENNGDNIWRCYDKSFVNAKYYLGETVNPDFNVIQEDYGQFEEDGVIYDCERYEDTWEICNIKTYDQWFSYDDELTFDELQNEKWYPLESKEGSVANSSMRRNDMKIKSSRKPIKSSHDVETLKKVIRAYLDKMGYKDVEGGVDAAADYIWQDEEHYSDYDLHSKVKQWFKETKENYPETLIKASKTIKSGYYDTREHPEGGGTCDNCHGEVMPGDGYESDFESSREMALEGIIDAFKLGNIDIHDYLARQQLIDFLDMEDEDELEDAISEICNMAFEGKGYQCPTCAQMNLGIAAKAWVEDNYDFDNEIESSAIKSAKSEFGYSAHETMTFDEFKNFVKSVVEPVEMFDYKSAYFVILNNEEDCKKLDNKLDDTYGVGCTYYPLRDPYNEHHGKWQLMA